jgi:hypothetical protein
MAILFLPVTTLLVQPSIQRITLLIGASSNQQMLLSSEMSQFVATVTIGAIAFYLLWGAIFGFIMRIRAHRVDHHVGMNV